MSTINTKPVSDAITAANTALNGLIDTVYADSKATGKGFDRLKVLGQAAKGLQSATSNLDKAFAARKPVTPAKKK